MKLLFALLIMIIQFFCVVGFILLGIGAIGINLDNGHVESGHEFASAGGYSLLVAFIALALMLAVGAIHKKLYPNYVAD